MTAEPPSIWVNGEPQRGGLHVSALDRGFMLADGVFETMRVRGGTVFRLGAHLARLRQGLTTLEIPVLGDLRDLVEDAVRAAGRRDASVRLTVTRGVGGAGVSPPSDVIPTIVLAISDPPVLAARIYEQGLSAHIPSGRRNERAATAGIKALAYTESICALLEARRANADEALFLDSEDHCSEATASNLFMWQDETLVTPPLTCGVLAGITRAAVLELAATLGIAVAERAFGLDEVARADEAFLTSSLRGLAPLVRVDHQTIGTGTAGDRVRLLSTAYEALVATECPDE